MDLLLLFLVGIVISEYTEKRSKFVNIVNSIAFIIFSVLIFYGSDNSLVIFAAKNTLNSELYANFHSALRFSFVMNGIAFSSYYSLLVLLSILMIIIATCFTVRIVKYMIKISKTKQPSKLIEKKYNFSIEKNENSDKKLYLVFGEFLS